MKNQFLIFVICLALVFAGMLLRNFLPIAGTGGLTERQLQEMLVDCERSENRKGARCVADVMIRVEE